MTSAVTGTVSSGLRLSHYHASHRLHEIRAVADQLEGNQSLHATYRDRCMDYMEEYPDHFKPFVFDEVCSEAERL